MRSRLDKILNRNVQEPIPNNRYHFNDIDRFVIEFYAHHMFALQLIFIELNRQSRMLGLRYVAVCHRHELNQLPHIQRPEGSLPNKFACLYI